ncbi:hypothetical protein HK099_006137, partial [Clydaea vesicula]
MLLVEQAALSSIDKLRHSFIVAVYSKTTMGDPALHFVVEQEELNGEQLCCLVELLKKFRNVDGFYVDVSYGSEVDWKNEKVKFGWKQIK